MLLLHSRTGEICRAPEDLGGNTLPPDLVWIDLLKPSPEEVAFVERATGLELPNYEALSEIESSSRLRAVNGALRSEEHTSELQSHSDLVCRLLLEKKKDSNTGAHQLGD